MNQRRTGKHSRQSPPLPSFPLVRWTVPWVLALALAAPAWGQGTGTDATSFADQARAAARADRNAEAAELFRRAIEAAPERRREWLADYADQLTYSKRPREAVPLYRELLGLQPAADDRIRLLKGLGLALLWSDQPGAARPVFEEVVLARPQDTDARRNLGRALSWSGRQREAAAFLEAFLRDHPDDGEARAMLAQAQAWSGRPEQARATLAHPSLAGRDDARKLAAELELWAAPRTRLEAQRSTQSNDLAIRSWAVGHEVPFQGGRGMLGARAERVDFEREDGTDDAQLLRPLLLGRYRFSDALELNARVGQDRIEPRGSPAMNRLVYATWLTWWPGDAWRIDLSTDRSTFDNLQSLRLGLTARQHGLSVDFTPSERERYTARLQRGKYSDGNRRWWGQLEGEYRLRTHPELWGGVRHTRMSFERLLSNGYFNPRDFQATQLTLRAVWRPGGTDSRWEINGFAAYGREHAEPGGSKPAYDVSLRAGYALDPRTRLELRAQRFSSRTSTQSGFERTIFGALLERAW